MLSLDKNRAFLLPLCVLQMNNQTSIQQLVQKEGGGTFVCHKHLRGFPTQVVVFLLVTTGWQEYELSHSRQTFNWHLNMTPVLTFQTLLEEIVHFLTFIFVHL